MKKIVIPIVAAIVMSGCYNDKAENLYPSPGTVTCDTTTVSYAKDIAPIFSAKCNTAGCHNSSAAAGYNFTTRAGIAPNTARVLGTINWAPGFSPMPKGGMKLDACDINKITRWVNQGALDN